MMFRIVLVQVVASLLAAALAAAAGTDAAVSALLGGLAVCLPNGLFALNLALAARLRGPVADDAAAGASALPLLLGEFTKVVLTAGLLAAVVWGYRGVVWPALIASIGAVLLAQTAALAWRRT